jgi:glycosyltransferase involved in cell wall biosynthesis
MTLATTEIEVTVIVPVYNRTDSLRHLVATIISQSDLMSVVIVDDGSAPESARVADELANSSSRVRAVHQANRGPAAARNTGLGATSTPLVMFLDSDDELANDAYSAISYPLLQHDVGMVCGAVRIVFPGGGMRTDQPAVFPGVPWAKLSWLAGSFAVRTDIARAVGGYDEALRFGENTDFTLRLAEECRRRSLRVAATNDVLSIYHASPDEHRYDAERLDAAIHLLRRGRFDLELPSERAKLHAIAAVNAARLGQYRRSVRHAAVAAFTEPRNARHVVRLALSLSGPLARRRWLKDERRGLR